MFHIYILPQIYSFCRYLQSSSTFYFKPFNIYFIFTINFHIYFWIYNNSIIYYYITIYIKIVMSSTNKYYITWSPFIVYISSYK